jgi:helix-turn-helix protein
VRDSALWHAITLLREYRGDGHIIALVANGLSGLEALITCAATHLCCNSPVLQRESASAPTMLAGCVAGAMTSGTQPPKA